MKESLQTKITIFCFLFLALTSKAQNQNALAFDGTDDLISTDAASSLIAGSNNMSMTCWVYPQNPTPNGTYDGFCGFRNNADADFYILHYNTTTVEARFRNSAGTAFDIIGSGIQINTWQHLTFTYDGSMLRYYRNGIKTDSVSATGSIANIADTFYMGGLPFGGTMFNLIGKLDEVSLWSKTLSQSEISCIYNGGIDSTDTGLQLLYRFNQGTANGNNTSITAITDAAGNMDGTPANFLMTGTVSNFVAGAITAQTTTASFCPGTNYIWGNDTITETGTYTHVFTSSLGCDSTVVLTLNSVVDTTVGWSGTSPFAAQTGLGVSYQWLNCGTGFSPVPGATTQLFTATANGSYAVKVTFNNCTDTSSCYAITNVGIEENIYSGNVKLSPNPAKNICTISAPLFLNSTLSLYDVTGKVVLIQVFNQHSSLSVDKLKPGIYFVELRNAEGISVRKKLVKE